MGKKNYTYTHDKQKQSWLRRCRMTSTCTTWHPAAPPCFQLYVHCGTLVIRQPHCTRSCRLGCVQVVTTWTVQRQQVRRQGMDRLVYRGRQAV